MNKYKKDIKKRRIRGGSRGKGEMRKKRKNKKYRKRDRMRRRRKLCKRKPTHTKYLAELITAS